MVVVSTFLIQKSDAILMSLVLITKTTVLVAYGISARAFNKIRLRHEKG